MNDLSSSFEPARVDFELRAIALRDYQRLVIGQETDKSTTSGRLDKRHFLWILGEITNIAYLPFSGSHIQVKNKQYKWAKERDLSENYKDCLKFANQIFDKVISTPSVQNELEEKTIITRREFLKLIEDIANEVLSVALIRTHIESLQNSQVENEKIWTLVQADENGKNPWKIPKLCSSMDQDVKDHRFLIVRQLNEVLQRDISEFEHESQLSEFGTPKISLMKVANAASLFSYSAKGRPEDVGSKYQVFPAEVGTILEFLQTKLEIDNKRHFVFALAGELNQLNLDSSNCNEIDRYFFS